MKPEEVIELLINEPDLLPGKCPNCGVYLKSEDLIGHKVLGKFLLFLILAGLAVLLVVRSWWWLPLSLPVITFSTIQILFCSGALLGFLVAGRCSKCGRSLMVPQYLTQIIREPGSGLFLGRREVSCHRCKKQIRPSIGNIVIQPPVGVWLVTLPVFVVLVLAIILPMHSFWWLFLSIPFGLFSMKILKNIVRKVIGVDLLVLCDRCNKLFTISRMRL